MYSAIWGLSGEVNIDKVSHKAMIYIETSLRLSINTQVLKPIF